MPEAADGQTDPETPRSFLPRTSRLAFSVMMYLGEILLIFVIFTSFANMQNGPLKVELQPPPVPFFPVNSSVEDSYTGDINSPFSTVMSSDVSLIMYYAPWDFDSQLARAEVDKVARRHRREVYFAAINCWVRHGDCHRSFPKIRSFPLLLGYIGSNKGIQYRGPLQQAYINKFIVQLLRPLRRVDRPSEFYSLLANSQALVTGYFNVSAPRAPGYYSFYTASLRYLEHDIHRDVTFAVVTNADAARRLAIPPLSEPDRPFDIRLHLYNETLIFPQNGTNVDVDKLVNWVLRRSHSPVRWLAPSGRKSHLMQHYIGDQKTASVVLFTPRLHERSLPVLIFKELVLEYGNCNSVTPARLSRLIQEMRSHIKAMEKEVLDVQQECSASARWLYECRCTNCSMRPPGSSDQDQQLEKMCLSHPPASWRWSVVPSDPPDPPDRTVQGLKCRVNNTLNFYMMDSVQYKAFATQLGYSGDRKAPTAAFIIDPKEESSFLLDQDLSRSSLHDLIVNYTTKNVNRILRRNTEPGGAVSEGVAEISGADFSQVVLRSPNDVVVLHRKSNCIFSDMAWRTFLKTRSLFRQNDPAIPVRLDMVVIDSERNDLPWQFTVDRYPTLILYPANGKMDSRSFPYAVELSVVNLVKFILSHLPVGKRIGWFVNSCNQAACWLEARRRIAVQMAVVRHKIRTVAGGDRHDQQLAYWLREMRFYREMNYELVRALARWQQTRGHDRYPDGIRFLDEP